MLHSYKSLRHAGLAAQDGEMGDLHDLYFDDRHWTLRYFVVDTHRWLPGRKVLLSPTVCGIPERHDEQLPVNLSREQIKSSPERSSELPVSRQLETEIHAHYGWPHYWEAYPGFGFAGAVGVPPTPVPPVGDVDVGRKETNMPAQDGDPDLRSANEVRHYYVGAVDGDVGHIDDFLIDDDGWVIRYLVIDTKNWLPGRKVLIAPQWIEGVAWAEQHVHTDLTRDRIKASPEYDTHRNIDRTYETRLFEYYQMPGYWV